MYVTVEFSHSEHLSITPFAHRLKEMDSSISQVYSCESDGQEFDWNLNSMQTAKPYSTYTSKTDSIHLTHYWDEKFPSENETYHLIVLNFVIRLSTAFIYWVFEK